MHPYISINTLCLETAPLDVQVVNVANLGARAISPTVEAVKEYGPGNARALFDQAGLVVATLTHRAFAYATAEEASSGRSRLNATIDIAEEIGAQTITMTTGGRGALIWAEAAKRFASEIAPCTEHARAAGVILSLEPTSPLYAEVSIAHRLADTITLARMAGIGVGIDLFACWFDSDIETAIAASGPLTSLVQISDYVAGDRGLPCRAVPGEGMMQLSRLIPLIVRSGYIGWFDLEIIGPRMEHERLEKLRQAAKQLGLWLGQYESGVGRG